MYRFQTIAEQMLSFASEQTYRLFISHSWGYNAEYEGLKRLLSNSPSFKWENLSIEKGNPIAAIADMKLSDLKVFRVLEKQISESDCFLIPMGMYANHSSWMQTEASLAVEANVPIIGVRPYGAERLPQCISGVTAECVYWQGTHDSGA